MAMLTRSAPTHVHAWLLGTLTLLLFTGCATTGAPRDDPAPEARALEIGYGTAQADHMAGSVTTVYGEDTNAPRFRSMAEMLARVPGVRVRESMGTVVSVTVRGATPLFVLDGMIFRGGINSIQPSAVASITVLKNPAETAIYGSRAAHGGVILIKTRTGGA